MTDMKPKYQIEDQLYILHENSIELCIVNEIKIKLNSISYTVLIEDRDDDDREYISLSIDEKYIHRSIDDLLQSLRDHFLEALKRGEI